MADIFTFDPASEFELIEALDFEEEVQRPEELRFFTLDEQLLDYFDKVLPKKKHISKFEYRRIAKDTERIRELYNRTIVVTDTDYAVETSRKTLDIPWIKPIYAKYEYDSYPFQERWLPLYDRASLGRPNFYPIMLSALPRPYKTIEEGVPIVNKSVLLSEDGTQEARALGSYKRTKTAFHEDGTYSVLEIPIQNTNDDIKRKGFYLGNRKVDIPNPLADHPFLSSTINRAYLTQESLEEVFPKLEAIMTHGVPTTTDPYKEGLTFLKVYDVSLRDIPWKLWKDRFPPVDTITANISPESISFPETQSDPAPSKSLQDTYVKPWITGLYPRLWLMEQEDCGQLVVKMVMSKSSEAGLVPPETLAEKPQPQFTPSTPEECLLTDTFDEFLNSGVYRADKKVCVPATFIPQERHSILTAGKIAWKESTEFDILKEHQKLLKQFQYFETPKKASIYEKFDATKESELRRDIRAILKDEERDDTDKADSIEKITRELNLDNQIYYDSSKLFVVCSHTLAILNREMEKDKFEFYSQWTAIDEGFRVCKFCGEQINSDVLVAQDEFDESGKLVMSYEVLQSEHSFHGGSFTNSLLELKQFFDLESAGESVFYILLSLLQVLPTETQLLPILQNIKGISTVLKANKKIQKQDKERIEGILGLAGMVTLLQTHNPFLIPRRSFGSKILKLSGFPRDTDDSKDSPVLDILISILKTTFESSPSTFKGPTTVLFRAILTKPKDVRKETILYLKQSFDKFKAQFISAKERYLSTPEPEKLPQLSLPLLFIEKREFNPSERLGEEEMMSICNVYRPLTFISGKLLPSVVQKPVELWKNINPSPRAEFMEFEFKKQPFIEISDAQIRKTIQLGFPKKLKLEKIETFLKSDSDGIAFLSLLSRILDILSKQKVSLELIQEYRNRTVFLQTRINNSLFRDSVKGLVYQLFHDIESIPGILNVLQQYVQRDLTLNMILVTKQEAIKQDIELRAKERETFKQRMRQMDDEQRKATKMLLDIGIASYIITNEDREFFAKEYKYPDPELEYAIAEAESELIPQEQPNLTDNEPADTGFGDYDSSIFGMNNSDYGGSGTMDDGEDYGI